MRFRYVQIVQIVQIIYIYIIYIYNILYIDVFSFQAFDLMWCNVQSRGSVWPHEI